MHILLWKASFQAVLERFGLSHPNGFSSEGSIDGGVYLESVTRKVSLEGTVLLAGAQPESGCGSRVSCRKEESITER